MSDLYTHSCRPITEEMRCDVCARDTKHESQSRLFSVPNVLVVQIVRSGEERPEVAVEEQFEAPGLPGMDLAGVVYHNGATFKSGHYTCVCRGPGGRFWFYDDGQAVVRMEKDVGHVKPRAVYMVVYCRKGGGAVWQEQAGVEADVVDVDVDDSGRAGGDGGGVGGSGSEGVQRWRGLKRKMNGCSDADAAVVEQAEAACGAASPSSAARGNVNRSFGADWSVGVASPRRLRRKTSDGGSFHAAGQAATPLRGTGATPQATGDRRQGAGERDGRRTPTPRRLNRKTSDAGSFDGAGQAARTLRDTGATPEANVELGVEMRAASPVVREAKTPE